MTSDAPDPASPRWQLDSIFPAIGSDAYASALEEITAGLDSLDELAEANGIRGENTATAADIPLAEQVLRLTDTVHSGLVDVISYLYCRISTDSFDEEAQAALSLVQPLRTRASILSTRVTRWLAGLPLAEASASSDFLAQHQYALERAGLTAQYLLAPEAEAIVAAIAPSGGAAFARLHDALISRETIRVALPGRSEEEHSVAGLGTFSSDPDAKLREAAYRAELELLGRNQTSFAAAMNSVKGEVGELSRQRGFATVLDEELFGSDLSAAALTAMQDACKEHFPLMRRFMRAKAGLLGKDRLAWFDIEAPVGGEASGSRRDWAAAREFIISNFRRYSPDLAGFAERAFDANWIDAPPSKGKSTGAFCISMPGKRESRVLMNFSGTLDDIFTIAHELGHAWHNELKFRAGRTSQQRQTPMILAETASIFCETLVFQAVYGAASEAEKLVTLDRDLTHATQLLMDIHSRFLFEQGVFQRRAERELSERELLELMLDAQEQTYGDGLDAEHRHPLMWAQKSHYYSTGLSYYNFPYTFGYLFGLGLYSEFERSPEGFEERYNELLSRTGMAGSQELATSFGIDLEDSAFWHRSLSILEDRVNEYERLAAAS